MMIRIILTILISAILPTVAIAKDAGDIQADLDKQFPGKVVGVAQKGDQAVVNQFASGVTEQERSAINSYLAAYDVAGEGKKELDKRVSDKKDELDEPANSAKVSDEEYEALWLKVQAKLDRAKRLKDLVRKQEKIDEAAALIDSAKDEKP